jgi:hypothetical protein
LHPHIGIPPVSCFWKAGIKPLNAEKSIMIPPLPKNRRRRNLQRPVGEYRFINEQIPVPGTGTITPPQIDEMSQLHLADRPGSMAVAQWVLQNCKFAKNLDV